MKEIQEQTFTIIAQPEGQAGIESQIEVAGRTAYQSSKSKLSTHQFYVNMGMNKHFATYEFGTVYLTVPKHYADPEIILMINLLLSNRFSKYMEDDEFYYITTNERVVVENHLQDMKMFMTNGNVPTKYHIKRIAVKIITCRQITHETVRHRGANGNSFLQESTRFCYYLKDKFGAELTFIKPTWLDDEENNVAPVDNRNFFRKYWDKFRFWLADVPDYASLTNKDFYHEALKSCEKFYFGLANRGWIAQQCAMVLNNALKSEICVCMYEDDWNHFFNLRTSYIHETGMPHPLMYDIANKIYNEFKKQKLVRNLPEIPKKVEKAPVDKSKGNKTND